MSTATTTAHRDGAALAYRVIGKPSHELPPLLMVMGWTGVKEDWDSLPQTLGQKRQVVVFDNRGIGESTVTEGPYSMEQLADDAMAVAEQAGLQTFDLMGISMGGMIAQTLALNYGPRIRRLVLGCTTHGGPRQVLPDGGPMSVLQNTHGKDRRAMSEALLSINIPADFRAANPAIWEALVERSMTHKRPMRGIVHQLGAIMGFDVADRLSQITTPTLVVHGTADALLPYGNGQLLERGIRGSRLHTLEGAGHMFWITHPEQTARTLSHFLDAA